MATTRGRYFIKRAESDVWEDVAIKFQGLSILSIEGMGEVGDACNVYSEQFIDSPNEDFQITSTQDNPSTREIIRKNVDLSMTFICGERYGAQDTQMCYEDFVSYIARQGDFWIKSGYTGLQAHVVCLKGFKPTTQKLQRGTKSYMMATAPLHCLAPATEAQDAAEGEIYVGFGAATISTEAQIQSLTNVQHRNVSDYTYTYTIVNPSTAYLWICVRGTLDAYSVNANGFEIPKNTPLTIGEYRCYRSTNSILAHTMTFNIEHNS